MHRGTEKLLCLERINYWGAWVAQLVEHLTLGFRSSHDLRVVRQSPELGSVLNKESA